MVRDTILKMPHSAVYDLMYATALELVKIVLLSSKANIACFVYFSEQLSFSRNLRHIFFLFGKRICQYVGF